MSGARKRRGTTLVELSLVIAILAMVALPSAAFVSQNLKTTVQSSTQLKEQMVLEQVMQDMEKHLRSAVRTPSLMNPTPNEIVFYSVVPEAVASNLPKQTQYKYSLADGLLTKSVDTASATFPDGLEAGMITSMTFPEGNLDPTNPPCYITVLLEAGTTAPEKTVLRKTIYLRNYTSTVSIVKILGVTVPRTGDFPVTTITPTTQYTGIVAWTPALPVGEKFKNATEYTATITVAPIGGYTLTGVAANFFTVAGASVAVPNDINAGIVITGEFPMTGEIGATPLAITLPTLTLSKPYDGNTTAVVTAGTLIGVVSPDIVTVTAVATYDTAAVGMGKTITVVYSLAGADAAKYVKPVDYTVTTGVITAEAITVTATGPTKVYGTALTAGTSTTNFTASGAIAGETVTSVTLTPDAAGLSATTAAGAAYVVTPSLATGTGGFLASNYTITYVAYNGTVGQKALTVTATAGQSKTYGAADPTFAYTFAPALVGSDVMSGALSRATGENVGTYAITQGTLTAGTNYTITFVSSTFSVTAKSITAIGVITDDKFKIGSVLTAGALTPSGATVTYQWQRANSASGPYTDISVATSSTYTPVTPADKNMFIRVVATGTGNYSGTVTSAATEKINP